MWFKYDSNRTIISRFFFDVKVAHHLQKLIVWGGILLGFHKCRTPPILLGFHKWRTPPHYSPSESSMGARIISGGARHLWKPNSIPPQQKKIETRERETDPQKSLLENLCFFVYIICYISLIFHHFYLQLKYLGFNQSNNKN